MAMHGGPVPGALTVSDGTMLTTGNIGSVDLCTLWPTYVPPTSTSVWYSYPVYQASKTEQAFKIVAKLLEQKIIDELTVKKFITLVNEIAEIL